MHKVEQKLKPLVLRHVEFLVDDKVVKRGKIMVFNTKQFFIKFKMDTDQGIKDYEIPYPFSLKDAPDGYLFDYSLSAFVPPTEETYWKLRMINSQGSSKLYNNYLYVRTLSAP